MPGGRQSGGGGTGTLRPPSRRAGLQDGVGATWVRAGDWRKQPGWDGSCSLWFGCVHFARKAFGSYGCRSGEPDRGEQGRRGLSPG